MPGASSLAHPIIMIGQAKERLKYGRLVGNPEAAGPTAIYIAVRGCGTRRHRGQRKAGRVHRLSRCADTDHTTAASYNLPGTGSGGKSCGAFRIRTGPSSEPEECRTAHPDGRERGTFDPIDRQGLVSGGLDAGAPTGDSDGKPSPGAVGGAKSARAARARRWLPTLLRKLPPGAEPGGLHQLSPRRGGEWLGGAAGDHHTAHAGMANGNIRRPANVPLFPARRAGRRIDDQPDRGAHAAS